MPAEANRSIDFSLFEENGKVGLKDEGGQVLIPAAYEAIGWSNGKLSIVDKVVGYQSNGLWGLIHTSNRIITTAEFLELTPGEGSFLVAQKKSPLSQRPSFGVINTSGKIVIPFQYDALHLSNMRAIAMSRTGIRYHFGLVDMSNKILIPFDYQRIYSLGSLRYAVENFANKTAIFAEDGTQVTGFTIDSISSFKKDYAIIHQEQRQGVIDRNGQLILKPVYGAIRLNGDGTIDARERDSWIFLDAENNATGRLEADGITPLSGNRYAIISGGKIQLTDSDFQPLHGNYFSSFGDFRNGRALYRDNSRTGAISIDGKVLIPAEYRNLIADNDVFLACQDIGSRDRWVVLDITGKTVTEKHYQAILPYNGKFYPVMNRGYWGAVDKSGKEMITCVHDSLLQQHADLVAVKFKGEFGIINLRENWIVTPQPNRLRILNETLYFEYAGKTTYLKSITGNLIYFSENALEYKNGYIVEHLPSGAYWIVNTSGIIIDRSNQPDETERIFPETEGLRAIYKDGKYGFIDDQGRLRVANRYEDVRPFSEGLAAIRIQGKWGFIDHQEKIAVQPVYDQVENFHKGFSVVRQNDFAGLIDESGRLVLPVRYDEITMTDEDRFLLRQGRSYGLADARGAIIIHPKYDRLTDTNNGYVIVGRGGKFGLLTLRGVSTIPMIYDALAFDPHHNQYIAMKRSDWKRVAAQSSIIKGQ